MRVRQALLSWVIGASFARVSIEYLIRGQKGPRRQAKLIGRAAAMCVTGKTGHSVPWQVLLDWLIDHPEEIEGITPKHFAWLVEAVRANGGWFAINRWN